MTITLSVGSFKAIWSSVTWILLYVVIVLSTNDCSVAGQVKIRLTKIHHQVDLNTPPSHLKVKVYFVVMYV